MASRPAVLIKFDVKEVENAWLVSCDPKVGINVGRSGALGGAWGNPFSHLPGSLARWRCESVEEAVDLYYTFILTSQHPQAQWIRANIGRLRNRKLYCPGRCTAGVGGPCHALVLVHLATPDTAY